MKYYKIILLLFTINTSLACDICGCGNGSSFFGILPQSHFRFAGLRYQYYSYLTHGAIPSIRSVENFKVVEGWLRLYPLPKTQLIVLMPYRMSTQTLTSTNQKLKLNGLGDVSVIAHYNLRNSLFDSSLHKFDQIWLIGGGIKLPTGQYKYEISDHTVSNPNFQAGTGSFDFILNTIYTVRKNNWGSNVDLTYKINTQNRDLYRFGNKTRLSANTFYQKKLGNLMLMPNTGLSFENYEKDRQEGSINHLSGGKLIAGSLGTEFYFKKFTSGFLVQLPLYQYLSNNELKFQKSIMTHFTFLF